MTNKNREIEYAGYVLGGEFGGAASHPQFQHIHYPPKNYCFTQNPQPLDSDYCEALESLINSLEKEQGKLRKSHDIANFFWSNLTQRAISYGASICDVKDFLKERNISFQTQIPCRAKLVFIPTIPYSINLVPWVIEIEDSTTLFFPYIHNGETSSVDVRQLRFYPVIKALLESQQCHAIITHVRSTANNLVNLFDSKIIQDKTIFTPIGVKLPNLNSKKKINLNSINVLFSNSWNQKYTNFFLRGGHDVLEAFFFLLDKYPSLNLILRSKIPNLNQKHLTLIQSHPRIKIIEDFLTEKELHELMLNIDIYLVPSARLHVMSAVKALSYGIPVIASDGWGFSEYIQDKVNGFLIPGRYGICSWIDSENGMLREDYSTIKHSEGTTPQIVEGIIKSVSSLVENQQLIEKMSIQARKTVEEKFSLDLWNKVLKQSFDNFFESESLEQYLQISICKLEMKLEQTQKNLIKTRHELGKFLPQYPDPVLLEDFGPYNIVGWGNEYYGIPKQLGKIDITSDNLSELENIFVYLSLEGLKKTIQKYLNNLDIFQQTQTQLQQTQTQLQQTQTQLQQTQTQLQQTQAQLQQTQAQLQQTQAQLQQTQTQLQQTQARIEAMESSKFWKLRRAWFKVKKRLGLPTGES